MIFLPVQQYRFLHHQILYTSKLEEQQRNYSLLCWSLTKKNTAKTTKIIWNNKKNHSLQLLFSTTKAQGYLVPFSSSLPSLKYPLTFSTVSSSSFSSPSIPWRRRQLFKYYSASLNISQFKSILYIIAIRGSIMERCQEQTCRGGISCCRFDEQLGAYCVTDTYCNAIPPLWQTIFIPIFLFLATLGILAVIYYKYRNMQPYLFTLGDFVERQLRLEPMERNEHTKLRTITSFQQ